MARENIAAVLAAKVENGVMTMDVARMVARRLMHDNPSEFYGIS